jgi:hypothetical protein
MRRSGDIFSGKGGKSIVKKAVEDLLPREIVYRPKMGFPAVGILMYRERNIVVSGGRHARKTVPKVPILATSLNRLV